MAHGVLVLRTTHQHEQTNKQIVPMNLLIPSSKISALIPVGEDLHVLRNGYFNAISVQFRVNPSEKVYTPCNWLL